MKLIFAGLAVFAVIMVLLAGSGVFWLTMSTLEQNKQESVKALATGLAYGVSSQMQLFEQTVEKIALDEDVIAAIESSDADLIEKTAHKVQKFLPAALKVRLLAASVNAVDEREEPVMGYADLDIVKKTLIAKQPSIIQGEGTNRHLAVTASIKKDGQVIGVVLASLKFDFLTEILKKAPIKDNFMEITQDSVVLGSGGDSSIKGNNPQQLRIANSPWQVSYASASVQGLSGLGMMIGLVLGLAVLTCIALFLGYYYMAGLLKKDQDIVLEAVKNLMTGKGIGTYQLKLNEMQVIISTLVQFKHIIDNKKTRADGTQEQSKTINIDDFDALSDTEASSDIENSSSRLSKKKSGETYR